MTIPLEQEAGINGRVPHSRATTGPVLLPTPVFPEPSFLRHMADIDRAVNMAMSSISPELDVATHSHHRASRRRDPDSERTPSRLRRRDRPTEHSAVVVDPEEDGYDSDIALATALSLSVETSRFISMTPALSASPDVVEPSPDARNHRSRRSGRSHRHTRHDRNEGTHASQAQCPICLEDMSGRAVVGAPCGHMLCRTCRSNLINSSDTWPKCHMCRMPYAV